MYNGQELEAYEYNIDYHSGECDDIIFVVIHEESGPDIDIEVFRSEYTACRYARMLARTSAEMKDSVVELPPSGDCALMLRYDFEDYVYVDRKCVRDG